MDMKTAEADYQEKLSTFSKYRKQGIDLVFVCDRCGGFVFQSDILYGLGCRKCGSLRVCPITEGLTWFGVLYCRFFNWIHEKINRRVKKVQ